MSNENMENTSIVSFGWWQHIDSSTMKCLATVSLPDKHSREVLLRLTWQPYFGAHQYTVVCGDIAVQWYATRSDKTLHDEQDATRHSESLALRHLLR